MHAHRTRLAAVTAVLLLAGPLSTVSTPAEAGVQVQRSISIRGIEPHDDRFFAKGRVRPTYARREGILQRRVGRDGRWRAWEEFRTTDRSRYREPITALRRPGRVFYRVKVEASNGFETSFSGSIWIRTFRA